jgi:hypothetical protein
MQMPNEDKILRFFLLAAAIICYIGCAEVGDRVKDVTEEVSRMIGGSDLPTPIATSLEMMPKDAALVAVAVERQIAERGNASIQGMLFMGAARSQLAKASPPVDGLTRKAVHLYEYRAFPENPIIKKTSGRLIYEGLSGRRTSIRYEAQFRPGGDGLIVDYAAAEQYFSNNPEPILFIVDAAILPRQGNRYPNSYSALMEFVGRRAIPGNASLSTTTLERDYVVFVFFRDRVSPSAKISVRIANRASGLSGFENATQYLNYHGWIVAALPGRFAVPGSPATPALYIKAIHTPGKEAGLLRSPKLVGLFHISGTKRPE